MSRCWGNGAGPRRTVIRDVSGNELRLFGEVVARLERLARKPIPAPSSSTT
jgi:hypothetical protein